MQHRGEFQTRGTLPRASAAVEEAVQNQDNAPNYDSYVWLFHLCGHWWVEKIRGHKVRGTLCLKRWDLMSFVTQCPHPRKRMSDCVIVPKSYCRKGNEASATDSVAWTRTKCDDSCINMWHRHALSTCLYFPAWKISPENVAQRTTGMFGNGTSIGLDKQ